MSMVKGRIFNTLETLRNPCELLAKVGKGGAHCRVGAMNPVFLREIWA